MTIFPPLPGVDTPLIASARGGDIHAVRTMLDAGAHIDHVGAKGGTALCWAADNGHADVVALLLERGANRHRGMGPGHWAYTSGQGIQWDVVEVTRADNDVHAAWRGGGLPVERRDNFTMTELQVVNMPELWIAGIDTTVPIRHAQFAEVDARFMRNADYLLIEASKSGPNFARYSDFSTPDSSYTDPESFFRLFLGCSAEPDFALGSGREAVTCHLPGGKFASVMMKGAYTQMGYAHALLRQWVEDKGLIDACRELREIYHYQEAPQSDANITQLLLAIDP